MNNKTKHDLSAGVATLNLDNLIEVAQIAAGLAKTNVERELGNLQNNTLYHRARTDRHMIDARNLADAANAAQIAFENLHYLIEAKNRDTVNVIK